MAHLKQNLKKQRGQLMEGAALRARVSKLTHRMPQLEQLERELRIESWELLPQYDLFSSWKMQE